MHWLHVSRVGQSNDEHTAGKYEARGLGMLGGCFPKKSTVGSWDATRISSIVHYLTHHHRAPKAKCTTVISSQAPATPQFSPLFGIAN